MEAPNLYTLPAIYFVGGETQQLSFHIYSHMNKRPFSLSGCKAQISIAEIKNKFGEPVVVKEMSAVSENGTDNVLTVTLEADETVDLQGKYIYQIQIMDVDGTVEIPNQGVMYITNNINKSFLKWRPS